ncbi:MAG: tyrosine-type recombinase/integrase [Gammaproteobacteria bacterium]|nr:tyrosine-type recombinase/integrase [Gammaproteobacteria bacterium]
MSDKTMHLILALYNNARKRHINEADNTGFIKHNPVEVLNVEKSWKVNNGQSRRKRECIDTDDLKCVLDALEALEFYKDGIKFKYKTTTAAVVCSHFFRLMFFTGWRLEETCKLKWRQLTDDLKDATWDDSDAIKNLKGADEIYRFPLNSEAVKVLQSLKSYNFQSKYVFPINKMTTHINQNPTIYIDILQKLVGNNKRYTCGIYRKTFQTYAEECGINSTTIKRLVFHTQKVYDTQSGYIATNREAFRKHSQKVCDFILYYSKSTIQSSNEPVIIHTELLSKATNLAYESELTRDEMINKLIETGIQFELMKKMGGT